MASTANHYIDIANQIRHSKMSTSEICEKCGTVPQWVSRLRFIAKADLETRTRLATLSKSALKRIIDDVKSKTKGRTLATKLTKLKAALEGIKTRNKGSNAFSSKDKLQLESARERLAQEIVERKIARSDLKTLEYQHSELQEKYARLLRSAKQLKLFYDRHRPKHQAHAKDPNTLFLEDQLREKMKVKTTISSSSVIFDCGNDRVLSGLVEKLLDDNPRPR